MTAPPGVLRLGPGELYWALLDAPPRATEEALRYAFEPHLPAPLDEIETRFVRLAHRDASSSARWLACGIEGQRLADRIGAQEAAGARVESAVPGGLPQAVLDSGLLSERELAVLDARALAGLEFRRGEFESPRRAARRRAALRLTLAAACSSSTLLTAGLLAGAAARHDAASGVDASSRSLAASALAIADGLAPGFGPENATVPSALPASVDPRLALRGRLRAAEQGRAARDASLALAQDVVRPFLDLLSAWPEEPATRVDELRLDQTSASVRGAVREAGDAERLAQALARESWAIGAVQASRAAEGYTMSLVLRPVDPAPGAPGTPGADGKSTQSLTRAGTQTTEGAEQ